MDRYAIADWLSPKEKRRAVEAEYVPHADYGWVAAADGESCALGVALGFGRPLPMSVASFLTSTRRRAMGVSSWERVASDAGDFMGAWDKGFIRPDQLPIALGLEVA